MMTKHKPGLVGAHEPRRLRRLPRAWSIVPKLLFIGLICTVVSWLRWHSGHTSLVPFSGSFSPVKSPQLPADPSFTPLFLDDAPESLRTPANLPLTTRLITFLNRPAVDHSAMKDESEKGCPLKSASHLELGDFDQEFGGDWRALSGQELYSRRMRVLDYLGKVARAGWTLVAEDGSDSRAVGTGQGLVTAAGNGDTVDRLKTLLKHLRLHLKSTLPIEVFHFSHELRDPLERDEIEQLGGILREVVPPTPDTTMSGWIIKPLALIQSSFREIMWIDTGNQPPSARRLSTYTVDNLPLRDPGYLFDSPTYKAHGSAFWPDLWKTHPHNPTWRFLGRPCTRDDWTFETGQILFDTTGNGGLNLAVLWIASHLMNDYDFWRKAMWGDKDAFRLAYWVLDLPFGRAPRYPSLLGYNRWFRGFCGGSQLQMDLDIPSGFTELRPLFVHYNTLKRHSAKPNSHMFTHVMKMKQDDWSEPSLDNGHGNLGTCINMKWHGREPPPDGQEIMSIPIEKMDGNPLEGFEAAFWGAGGHGYYPIDQY